MKHAPLRVRCNGRGLLPFPHQASRVTRSFVGWQRLRRPSFHAADVALNAQRAEVGLPLVQQHQIGDDGPWFVPKERVTLLRAKTHEELRYYANAIVEGDLVSLDETTKRIAEVVEEGRLAELEEMACSQNG